MMSCIPVLLLFGLTTATTVRFDIQPIASAVNVASENVVRQLPESRLVQVRLDVSTIVAPQFRGAMDEAMIKFGTRTPTVQVADYWPRTEMYTSVTTPVSVDEAYDRRRQASLQGIGGYPGAGSAQGYVYSHDNAHRDLTYQEAAPKQLLTAAGTIDRGTGVYFKLRSTPQAVLEGSRTFVLTLEVPMNWRGGILEVQAFAYGRTNIDSKQHNKQLGGERFLVSVYADGDSESAQYALAFMHQQSRLRIVANQFSEKIEKRAYPTPVHKLGQVLDIYEPLVSTDYLQQWIFQAEQGAMPNSRLPVDLRVAMLDFIDSRSVLESMSGISHPRPSAINANLAHNSPYSNSAH